MQFFARERVVLCVAGIKGDRAALNWLQNLLAVCFSIQKTLHVVRTVLLSQSERMRAKHSAGTHSEYVNILQVHTVSM